MGDSQLPRQEIGADESKAEKENEAVEKVVSSESTTDQNDDLGEKIKNIDVKPSVSLQPPPPTLAAPKGLPDKNSQPIGRVKQLRGTAMKESAAIVSSGSATGNPRNKTALAPGHSLMDWIRLGSSGVDLTGVGGRLLTVTPTELSKHNKENDAWIAIRGIVFNITRYMAFHPGGVPELMKGAGKDATKLFDDVHAWVNYQSILQKCVVGRLERSINAELYFKSDKDKPKNKAEDNVAPKNSTVKLDWRQTSNSISLFLTKSKEDGTFGECQVRRDADKEFILKIKIEKVNEITKCSVKFDDDVEWPPNCRMSSEAHEIELAFKKKNRGIWRCYGTSTISREESKLKSPSTQTTYNEYEVLENIGLCKVVHLLVLRAQNYIQLVPAGRHVLVKMNVMGTEVSRPYTPVPNYLHPEDRPNSASDDCICLMIKRYEDGALSPSLTALKVGDKVELSNALGSFEPTKFDDCSTMHLLAAGSGLTVMLAIIKRALSKRYPPTINLVNFNKDEDNLFYTKELEKVSKEKILKITHVLTSAKDTWQGKRATLSEELLEELIGRGVEKACVFTCGPKGFMQLAKVSLQNLGWQRIHEFDD